MSDAAKLTTEEAAEYVGIPAKKLKNWRRFTDTGPSYYKLGGSIFYTTEDLDAWVDSCKVEN